MKRAVSILTLAFAFVIVALGQGASAPHIQAEKLSKKQLLSLIATAKTPAEHERIATYYEGKAQDYLAKSTEHQEMAEQYKKNHFMGSPKNSMMGVNHCEDFAKSFQKMSAEMHELAQLHDQMAKDAQLK
jgi:hypothetical protein